MDTEWTVQVPGRVGTVPAEGVDVQGVVLQVLSTGGNLSTPGPFVQGIQGETTKVVHSTIEGPMGDRDLPVRLGGKNVSLLPC